MDVFSVPDSIISKFCDGWKKFLGEVDRFGLKK